METTAEKKSLEFYGGLGGAIIPMIVIVFAITGLLLLGYDSSKCFWSAALLGLMLSFILCKDKKRFNDIVVSGIANPMYATMLVAWYLAGITAQLLADGGLVNGLLWAAGKLNVGAHFIPVITFLICAVLSTCTGTLGGTVATVTPVMFPLAIQLGCSPILMAGAILGGSAFGDNLAPVSDTTIASAVTQGAELKDVVKSRLPYSLIAGAISVVLYTILGFTTASSAPAAIELDPNVAKSLLLLISPAVLIFVMVRGASLVSALLTCNIITVIISLAAGLISFDQLVNSNGVIVNGMLSMTSLTLFAMFIFALIQVMTESGIYDKLINSLNSKIKTPRGAELACIFMTIVGSMMTSSQTATIVLVGSPTKSLLERFNVVATRGSNLLDCFATGGGSLIPWNLGTLMVFSYCFSTAGDLLSATDVRLAMIPLFNFHCIGLCLLFFLSCLTGIGRKYRSES